MSDYRKGMVTHKMIVAEYDLLRMDVASRSLERLHKVMKGNWSYNKIWNYEYTANSRDHAEEGKAFLGIENYDEKAFIVGMPNDDYFSQAKVLKEVTPETREKAEAEMKARRDYAGL